MRKLVNITKYKTEPTNQLTNLPLSVSLQLAYCSHSPQVMQAPIRLLTDTFSASSKGSFKGQMTSCYPTKIMKWRHESRNY